MKKSVLRVMGFAVAIALLFMGCEDSASQNNQELVDGFLDRVNQKPETVPPGAGAETKYPVTVSSIGSGKYGDNNYAEGATVVIYAGSLPFPRRFIKWTTDSRGVNFANESDANTAFTMPAHAVTVTAVFFDLDTLTDGRDGKKYKTTTIDGKKWMAENLNYQTTSGSWCYNDSPDSCAKYGMLYDWETARTVCPSGWHLPDRQEWDNLVTTAGGANTAGRKLKATSGWLEYLYTESNGRQTWNSGNGTDELLFSALPGGYRYAYGSFYNAGNDGFWWAATEVGSGYAYYRGMYYNLDYVNEDPGDVGNGYSLRCRED
jgi:uncharacterized protein (TIGR02145 family)